MLRTGLLAFAVLSSALTATAQQSVWGQCTFFNLYLTTSKLLTVLSVQHQGGGIGWTGPTTCVSGSTCVRQNDYYYQCLPGAATTTTSNLPSTTPTTTTTGPSPPSTTTTAPGSSQTCPSLRRMKH
ncbi:hypothetical protein A7U60_g4781 [Sanghuangporus baumii]|uniref:CBM1 domain-containing protein n=1 Tax=Sanghuangporus baumii TaxID=108892 RepID=A0A9Q5HY38_SANBA|nr:hypothetical protein A7U60_g4781 [Sanghuangporus baumii]